MLLELFVLYSLQFPQSVSKQLIALVVGLAVSMFMAATSISEQTLTFIPKLLITFGILLFAGPYMLNRLMEYMIQMYINIPMYLSGTVV